MKIAILKKVSLLIFIFTSAGAWTAYYANDRITEFISMILCVSFGMIYVKIQE